MAKFTFMETFGVTAMITGTTTHYINDTVGSIQSMDPIYQLGHFGISAMASSGNWGIRIMATMPDGTLFPIAASTAVASNTRTMMSNATGFTTSAGILPGIPRPTAIEYTRVAGASGNLSTRVWGVLYNTP